MNKYEQSNTEIKAKESDTIGTFAFCLDFTFGRFFNQSRHPVVHRLF